MKVFNSTNNQQVFELSSIEVLEDALHSPYQELSLKVCENVESWTSTPIEST